VVRRILVVDDSHDMHRLYASLFGICERWQITPLFAGDGSEGLAVLRQHPDTDLVLLDINMPVMDGIEFLTHLRSDATLGRVPVVLQTSETCPVTIQRGLAAGAMELLAKPFTQARLCEVLYRVLG
jgi:CheY-like chemotaxis protein